MKFIDTFIITMTLITEVKCANIRTLKDLEKRKINKGSKRMTILHGLTVVDFDFEYIYNNLITYQERIEIYEESLIYLHKVATLRLLSDTVLSFINNTAQSGIGIWLPKLKYFQGEWLQTLGLGLINTACDFITEQYLKVKGSEVLENLVISWKDSNPKWHINYYKYFEKDIALWNELK